MVIVRVIGGLGNQLFCYALCEKYLSQGKQVKIEKNYYAVEDESYGLIFSEFGKKYEVANEEELKKYADIKQDVINKARRMFFGARKTTYKEKKAYEYDAKVVELDNCYVAGYWQTEKYFKDIRKNILSAFKFDEFREEKNREIANQIQSNNSVCLHVRRGDYVDKYAFRFGNICEKGYFDKAIKYVKANVENPVFYVFSNDMEWAKKVYSGSEFRFIDWENSPHDDLHLMSLCKHNIISNSSFSWWGAWLGDSVNKLVVAPKKWVNDLDTPDIWCDEWIRI